MEALSPHAFTGTPCILRRVVFGIMLLFGLWNFFLNVAARYKEHPFNNINGFPLWILNLMYEVFNLRTLSVLSLTVVSTSTVWSACTVVYIGITWWYAKENP